MKTVFLRGDQLNHENLARAFGFPEYYGGNLDALHDCLTEIGCDTAVILSCLHRADEDGWRIYTVLADSARENPRLSLYVAVQIA